MLISMIKQKQNKIKPLAMAVFICVCLFIFLIPQTAFSAEVGSLAVYYRQDGVQFSLYRVADENGKKTEAFSDCGVSLPLDGDSSAVWQSAAEKLESYAEENKVSRFTQGTTSDGEVYFGELDSGLYLMLGARSTEDGQTYCPIPVLVRISGEERAIYAKDETIDPIKPSGQEDPAGPSEPGESPRPMLPQTGDIEEPFVLMIISGLCLLLAGVILYRGRGKKRQ